MGMVVGICLTGCFLTVVGAVLMYRYKIGGTYGRLEQMLSDAMDGSFTENRFDETRLSALEARWAQYLSTAGLTAKRQAEEKDKIKALISDISHQTKTPISNISLYSELLLEQELPLEAGGYAAALNEQAKKLNFLIAALIKMSRLETGVLALHPKRESVDSLLQRIYKELLPKAEEKGLNLILERTDEGHWAVFDEKWTTEAVINIVENAIKYTSQGSVFLRIIEYGLFACIQVEDTGMGIPEEEYTQIFARFYRSASVVGSEGIGIGLYLAREILSEEGGYIKVSSRLGKGSVFFVYLPK